MMAAAGNTFFFPWEVSLMEWLQASIGGTLLDDHAVRFENTRKPLFMVTRLLGGLAVYLVVNILLKLPFSKEFLSDGSTTALMARCAHYAIIAFVLFGIYPMLFMLENRTIEKGV